MKQPSFTFIAEQYSALLGGFLGSVISLRFITTSSLSERVCTVLCGTVMAQFLTPLIAKQIGLLAYQNAISFLAGLFGMSLCAAVFRGLSDVNWWHLIRDRWGKNYPDE